MYAEIRFKKEFTRNEAPKSYFTMCNKAKEICVTASFEYCSDIIVNILRCF